MLEEFFRDLFLLNTPHRQKEKKDINKFASHFENADSALSKELAIPPKQDFIRELDSSQVEFIEQEGSLKNSSSIILMIQTR